MLGRCFATTQAKARAVETVCGISANLPGGIIRGAPKTGMLSGEHEEAAVTTWSRNMDIKKDDWVRTLASLPRVTAELGGVAPPVAGDDGRYSRILKCKIKQPNILWSPMVNAEH